MGFKSPTHGELDYTQVIEKIAEYIKEDSDSVYKIIVGSDSEAKTGDVDFVTALIVHRLGKGGIYFWQKQKIKNQHNMHQRIAREAQMSLELAWKVRDDFQHNGLSAYEPEVHIDIGMEGVSRDMVKWVTGMILGSGFAFKIKPESFAASKVADRYT
ncbi:MAG TPA: ribonuclease H-like YkuK family protein [Candidatus Saccharimonadales bacterium]|nr:ribonuclease H-like YkuK family protein [Candidatus Saccharimonadales bacterium]